MGTLANSEDPDEMSHNTTFHQGLFYMLRKNKQSSEKEIYNIFWNPSIYTMGHPYLTVSSLIGTLVQKGYNNLLIETVLLSTHNVCFGC